MRNLPSLALGTLRPAHESEYTMRAAAPQKRVARLVEPLSARAKLDKHIRCERAPVQCRPPPQHQQLSLSCHLRARGSTERPLQTDRPRYGNVPFVRTSAATAEPFPAKPLPGSSRMEAPTQPGHSLPMTPGAALKLHLDTLSDYERGEIIEYTEIYCTGHGADKVRATLMASEAKPNHGAG